MCGKILSLSRLILLSGASLTPAATQQPDIAGRWTYNAAQSDNPRDNLRSGDTSGGQGSRRARPEGGGWGNFGGGGFRGGAHRGGPDMTDEQRARMRQTMQLAFDAPQSLTIAENDSTVSLTADADTLTLVANGRKVTRHVDGGGDVTITARWQGSDLVIERKVSGGGSVSEDYLRSKDGKQLYVIVSFVTARGRSIEFRRIYDQTQPG